jgi:regulator of sigma D
VDARRIDLVQDRTVKTFLKCRRQLIVELMKLSNAIETHLDEQAELHLERFCQQLVDYLSNGYFRIYGGVLSQRSWTTPREYAIFDATTSTAMTFNDHHAGGGHFDIACVRKELASVALALETRFELEDDMLNRTHERSAVPV